MHPSGRNRFSDINPFPSLFTIAPANRDHEVALRCGISVFVPLITLLLIDRIDLAIFASFGAFTAIYGRSFEHGPRLRAQLRAGTLMFVVIMLATLTGRFGVSEQETPWLLVFATALVAGAVTVVVAYWQLRPAGSLFQIFAFAAIASVPYQPPLLDVMITTLSTIVFSLLVGLSSRAILPSRRKPFAWPSREVLSREQHRTIWFDGLWYIVAAVAAGSLATGLGPVLGISHNYWAMVAAVVPLVGHSTSYRVSRGLQRVIGTFFGLAVMALIVLLEPPLWLMVLMISFLQFAAELFATRQYMLTMIVTTPLALLATVLATSSTGLPVDGGQLLYDRAIETVIGATVGIICVLFPWGWRRWVVERAPQ